MSLSFQDAIYCHTELHKIGRVRRNDTPAFVTDDRLLREVLVVFFERRAYGASADKRRAGLGAATQWERLRIAHEYCLSTLPRKLEILDEFCHEFVITTDDARRRILASHIAAMDSLILSTRKGPGLFAQIVWSYYRLGHNATEIATELHVTATFVRQTLHRMADAWRRVQQTNRT